MLKTLIALVAAAITFPAHAEESRLDKAINSMANTTEIITCQIATITLSGTKKVDPSLVNMITGMMMGSAATMTNLSTRNAVKSLYLASFAECAASPKSLFAKVLAENAIKLNQPGMEDALNAKE